MSLADISEKKLQKLWAAKDQRPKSAPPPGRAPKLGTLRPSTCWCGGDVKIVEAVWFDPVVPPTDTLSADSQPRWLYTSTCQKCGATDGPNTAYNSHG